MTWRALETAPLDGQRIRLGHERDASSMKVDSIFQTKGHWDGQRWVLSSFFIVPGGQHGLMASQPTHWWDDSGQSEQPVSNPDELGDIDTIGSHAGNGGTFDPLDGKGGGLGCGPRKHQPPRRLHGDVRNNSRISIRL